MVMLYYVIHIIHVFLFFTFLGQYSNPNYFETGTSCSASPYSCELNPASSFQCAPNDGICEDLTSQSECGKLMEAARGTTKVWGLHARTQIYWKESCEKDFNSIKSNRGPLQQAVATQYTLMIINTVANAFMIFICFTLILNLQGVDVPWIPYAGEQERELIGVCIFCFVFLIWSANFMFLIDFLLIIFCGECESTIFI